MSSLFDSCSYFQFNEVEFFLSCFSILLKYTTIAAFQSNLSAYCSKAEIPEQYGALYLYCVATIIVPSLLLQDGYLYRVRKASKQKQSLLLDHAAKEVWSSDCPQGIYIKYGLFCIDAKIQTPRLQIAKILQDFTSMVLGTNQTPSENVQLAGMYSVVIVRSFQVQKIDSASVVITHVFIINC